jgi:hypothetical protein
MTPTECLGEQMPFKEQKRMYFSAKVEIYSRKDGFYTVPFENWEDAEAEAKKYQEGGLVDSAKVLEWEDGDQAWWNEKKVTLVASFGDDYLDDKNCLGMLQMFQPLAKPRKK